MLNYPGKEITQSGLCSLGYEMTGILIHWGLKWDRLSEISLLEWLSLHQGDFRRL